MIDHESLPPASRVRLEFFPAVVSIPGTELPSGDLKVVITDTHMVVLANSAQGPTVALTEPIEDYTGRDKEARAWKLTLEGGIPVEISRADSCGCGSRLRGARLYPSAPRRK